MPLVNAILFRIGSAVSWSNCAFCLSGPEDTVKAPYCANSVGSYSCCIYFKDLIKLTAKGTDRSATTQALL